MKPTKTNPIFLYTMTNGLGDYLIMGDVMHKVEQIVPNAECIMVHRDNPHTQLWPYGEIKNKFFNIYSPQDFASLSMKLRQKRKEGALVFGLQMAPGSLQGFFMYSLLKKVGALDYIVDFNLINADIITQPVGNYLLDIQLNQIKQLMKVEIPPDHYRLRLPINFQSNGKSSNGRKTIGIHPWSRRGKYSCFTWTEENWILTIKHLLEHKPDYDLVVFGRDKNFEAFKNKITEQFPSFNQRISFLQSQNVPHLAQTVQNLDILMSVNTSVVHMGYALGKTVINLSGPTFEIWNPKASNIHTIRDIKADFPGSDRFIDEKFPTIQRIEPSAVIKIIDTIL